MPALSTDPQQALSLQGTEQLLGTPSPQHTGDIPWKTGHLPLDCSFIFPRSYIEGAAIRHITFTEQKGHHIFDAGRIDYASDSWHV